MITQQQGDLDVGVFRDQPKHTNPQGPLRNQFRRPLS